MKRALVVLIGLLLAGAAAWGLVTEGPYLRWYMRVRWRAIEASRREPAAIEAWRKAFGDPAASPPVHDDNATAVRLVEIAPAAGVNLRKPDDGVPVTGMGVYVSAEETPSAGPPAGPPPEAVRSYLDAHRSGLDAVVDLLTHGEAPVWKTEPWPTPSPTPLVGLLQLSSILAARAVAESSHGRAAEADRALLAAWQLSVSLRGRPELVDALLCLRMTNTPAMLARRLPVDPASWRVRLGDDDVQAIMMRSLVADAGRRFSAPASQMDRAAHADYLDSMRGYLLGLRDQPLTTQHAAFNEAEAMRDAWSSGAMVAVIGQASLDRAWLSAGLVMLQVELTDRVLHARQLKTTLGRWPPVLPDVETSRIAGVHWIYLVGQDGGMSISLSRPPESGRPLRFEAAGAPAR